MDFQEWLSVAKCRKRKNDFWYPPLDAETPENYYAIGREICHRCPIWEGCLNKGLNEKWGMWGGLTPNERLPIVSPNSFKPSLLKPHGSWLRYRQGCRCDDCITAHNQPTSDINMDVIPRWEEDVEDLEMLRFNLLTP